MYLCSHHPGPRVFRRGQWRGVRSAEDQRLSRMDIQHWQCFRHSLPNGLCQWHFIYRYALTIFIYLFVYLSEYRLQTMYHRHVFNYIPPLYKIYKNMFALCR